MTLDPKYKISALSFIGVEYLPEYLRARITRARKFLFNLLNAIYIYISMGKVYIRVTAHDTFPMILLY